MKMKNLKLMMTLTLTATAPALAQTTAPQPPSITTQVGISRDYAQSILTRIGSGGNNRFTDSTDLSHIGPELKKQMDQALTDFREGLEDIVLPSFNASIEVYNAIVRDKNLSETERK